MELEEIIKPYTLAPEPPKRPGAEAGPAAKRHLGDTAAAAAAAAAGGAAAAAAAEAGGALGGNTGKLSLEDLPDEIDANAVEKILEQADEMHVEEITEASIKRCAAQLERRIKKNQHDRIKFANNPEKWIKSEVDLDEELKRWSQVAASPSLFPQMFENGVFDLLVSLLSHANTDLAVDTAEVLTELTEADTVMEAPDPEGVVGQLMGSHLPEMVVDLLCRLKEDGGEDDALGISSCLTVIENLIELNPSLSLTLTQSQKLPAFLFRRIRGPPGAPGAPGAAAAAGGPPGAPGGPPAAANGFVVDGARLHAAEVLTLLLQHLGAPEKAQIGGRNGADGVDKLLRAIAPYRKKDPESSQEEELVLNLFDSLCSLLLVESNRELLGKQQGVELMLRIIKERRHFTPQAVKALDFALMDSAYNCNTFVERLGLRFLFSMFLGKEKDPKKKQKTNDELTEHIVSLINSLLKNCTGTPIARVLNKFQENQFEKVERLLELREIYKSKVQKIKKKQNVAEDLKEINQEMGVNSEERLYLDACEAGLSVLQQVDSIIVRLINAGNALVRLRLMDLMRMKSIDTADVEAVLAEFAAHMDDEATGPKEEVERLISNFKEAMEEEEEEEEEEE